MSKIDPNTTVTIKPNRIKGILDDVYRLSMEHTLYGFASGSLSINDAQDLYDHVKTGTASLPNINLSQSGNDVLIDVRHGDTLFMQEILNDEQIEEKEGTPTNFKTTVPKISEILAVLNEHVKGQAKAKKDCARTLKLHLEMVLGSSAHGTPLKKQNTLVHGPSGCGKTEIWEVLKAYAEKTFGIHLLIINASMLTASGYKGFNVEDVAKQLWLECDKDFEQAQKSLVVFDEFDKLGGLNASSTLSMRISVLNDLLKFIEGGKIFFKENSMAPKTECLDTKHITVVALGAFEGIESFFAQKGEIGLMAQRLQTETPSRNEIAEKVELEHFEKWGFNSQILGRFPIRTHILQLETSELVEIQEEAPNSTYHQWVERFARLNQSVTLEFTKPALKKIALMAIEQKTGARELDALFNATLAEAYDLADEDENINSIKIFIKDGTFEFSHTSEIEVLNTVMQGLHIQTDHSE